VLRWLLFEAAKASGADPVPEHSHYDQVKDRIDANRATLSQARRIVRKAVHVLADLGEDAFTLVANRHPAACRRVRCTRCGHGKRQ
jgi:hypothetical protein